MRNLRTRRRQVQGFVKMMRSGRNIPAVHAEMIWQLKILVATDFSKLPLPTITVKPSSLFSL